MLVMLVIGVWGGGEVQAKQPCRRRNTGRGGSSDGNSRDEELGPPVSQPPREASTCLVFTLWPLTSGPAVFHDSGPRSPSLISGFLLHFFTCFCFRRFCISASKVQLLRANWPDSRSHVKQAADVGARKTGTKSGSIGPSMPGPATLINPVSQPSERHARS